MALTIDELQIEIQSSATDATASIERLANTLSKLRTITRGGVGLTAVSKQFERLKSAIGSLGDLSAKIESIVSALRPLETIGKSNLGSALNQLKKIPEITANLQSEKIAEFAGKIQEVTAAVSPLATEMEKVSRGFALLPSRVQRVISANARLTSSNTMAAFSFNMIAIKAKIVLSVVNRIGNVIGNWIQTSSEYIENLNLFSVAMGKYADSAKEFAENVGELLGIDPSDWMRNQGVFMTLLTGFGVVEDKAALMSKQLTQLGYDISSFFNISVFEAMQKLQSGIAGELEPLRRIGYDLSQAKLQATALALGIDKNVSEMTQAEKAYLRYYAILTQVTTVQGDMARTLESPNNQLRILQAQLVQLSRALGNIFIPLLNKVLPYAIAFVRVLRDIANTIGVIVGFTLPEFDYSGVGQIGNDADEAADAFDELDKNAKKLTKTLLKFDELNVISSGDLKDTFEQLQGNFDIDLPAYDFLKNLTESKADQIFEKWSEDLAPFIEDLKNAVSALQEIANYAWNDRIVPFVSKLTQIFRENPELAKTITAVATALGTLYAVTKLDWVALTVIMTLSSIELAIGDLDVKEQIANALINVLAGAGIGAKFGGPMGALIGATVSIALSAIIVSFSTDSFRNGLKKIAALIKGDIETFLKPENLDIKFNWGDFLIAGMLPGVGALITFIKSIGARGGEAFINSWIEYFTNNDPLGKLIDLVLLSPLTFPFALKHFAETGETLGTTLSKSISEAFQKFTIELKEKIANWWENDIKPWFTKERWIKLWDDVKSGISETIVNIVDNVKTTFAELPERIGYELGLITGKIAKWCSDVINTVKTEVPKIIDNIVKWFAELPNKILSAINKVKDTIITWKDNVIRWVNTEMPKIINSIIDWFKKLPEALVNVGRNMIKAIWNGIVSVGTWLYEKIKSLFGFLWDAVKGFFQGFAQGFSVGYDPIPTYAKGGFPERGQLFIANETNVPEMVGVIGGRTAVANNDQIIEGIARGVYEAVTAALNNNSQSNIHVTLELDGKVLYDSIVAEDKNNARRTGRALLAY